VTSAEGTTPPDGSVTVPESVEVDICAASGTADRHRKASSMILGMK
jgi:hypothetical protein